MPSPTALYHLLLREGRTFRTAIDLLPWLRELGVSHLYLSPILQAVTGSTHGYDVTDPTRIDDSLGGAEGFAELARAAQNAGIAIVLDIVPNHTAFDMENPWLRDVLRHGTDSRFFPHFDIDPDKPLALPWLTAPFDPADWRMDDGHLTNGSLRVPVRPGTEGPDMAAMHAAQPWRLMHWEMERDSITHRRFFNVTGLIGMRVEDPRVFDDTHALIIDLVRSGQVQGLRVDHIDGLVDPKAYLDRLAAALPDTPVWVEKIVTGDERLPEDWKTLGTTGYETARALARVLTDPEGQDALDAMWRKRTGVSGDFEAALAHAKDEVIQGDLAAELHQLVALADAAVNPAAQAGPEWLREAVMALLRHAPRYRTYLTDGTLRDEDAAILDGMVQAAGADLRTGRIARAIVEAMRDAATPAARRLRDRFQQVTGALIAKSHEDTMLFRWNRNLGANDVGTLPDEAVLDAAGFQTFVRTIAKGQVNLTSSHDTKRAEDARMRLIAMTRLPDRAQALWDDADTLPQAGAVDANIRWYVVQTLLALWEPRDDLAARLHTHMEKALREAKVVTNWTHPHEPAEAAVQHFAAALLARWQADLPEPARELIDCADRLSLAQVALKFALPGIPYIYQGTEGMAHHLTDPDNRLAVDFAALPALDTPKARLTRTMMALRARAPDALSSAPVAVDSPTAGQLRLTREGLLEVRIALDGTPLPAGNVETDAAFISISQTLP